MIPTALESDILVWLSENAEDPTIALQAKSARVSGRDYTGAGYFVTLDVPAKIERLSQDSDDVAPFPGPYIESVELGHGGDTVFFVENGALSCLEIFAYGSTFPERLVEYRLKSIERLTPDKSLGRTEHE